ncbi:hypothetical protein PIB30_066467 [Stylosanthes scabra]|uniref:Uncharacterized protein n=1 Tax=Stylosanthes scabra TaxID=79078 RepID=A0ABU6UPR9_9FABA|nr:hypothetical protein [Stylosanthes scabra]
MTFTELQNGLCRSIEDHILKRVNKVLYRNPVMVFAGSIQFQTMPITDDMSMQQMFQIYRYTWFQVPNLELYVEFELIEHHRDKEEDEDNNTNDPLVQHAIQTFVRNNSFGIPSFMRDLELQVMNPLAKFPEFANIGVAAPEDGEFDIGMDFMSMESVISAYDDGCDWLIRASLIRRKGCWEIRKYNGRHTCIVGAAISQDHSKLDSDMIADVMRPLVEIDPTIQVTCDKMPGSKVKIQTLPTYVWDEEVHGVRILHRVFLDFLPLHQSVPTLQAVDTS